MKLEEIGRQFNVNDLLSETVTRGEKIYWRFASILSDLYWNLRNGFRGLLFWAPFAWRWRSWDYAYGLEALERHLVALEIDVRKGYGADRERHSRDIRVAVTLLRRIRRNESYLEELDPENTPNCLPFEGRFKRISKRERADWQYLFHHLRRHMRKWWD